MSGGAENIHSLTWESIFNLNDQLLRSEEKFEGDKLPDPNRFDTCPPLTTGKEVVQASSRDAGKKIMSPPNPKKDGNKSGADRGGGKGGSDHEIHIWTERERRKKMRSLFENLHGLLPQLPAKADKSTIVDTAVKHIRVLQHTFNNLQNQKIERLQLGMMRLSTMNHSMMTTQKYPSVGTSWEQFLADQGSTSNSAAITPTNNNNMSATPLLMNNNNIPTGFQTWCSPNVTLNICGEVAHISVCCPKKPGLFSLICYVLEKHKIELVSAQIQSDHVRTMFMIQAQAQGGGGLAEALSVEEVYKQVASEILSFATSE